jgi:hypothetical protein
VKGYIVFKREIAESLAWRWSRARAFPTNALWIEPFAFVVAEAANAA